MSARRRNVLGLWMNGLFVGHWKRPSHVSVDSILQGLQRAADRLLQQH